MRFFLGNSVCIPRKRWGAVFAFLLLELEYKYLEHFPFFLLFFFLHHSQLLLQLSTTQTNLSTMTHSIEVIVHRADDLKDVEVSTHSLSSFHLHFYFPPVSMSNKPNLNLVY